MYYVYILTNNADAVMDILTALLLVSLDAIYAVYAECIKAVHHNLGRLEATLRHSWLHSVEFHLSLLCAHRNAGVVTDNLVANLVHNLWNNRVYLTRHN